MTTQMRSFYYFLFGVGSPMSVVKPLLWLLEPYIVYKAYLWGVRFMAQPFTWEGELDWFAFMLTILLVIDVVALPLVIFYCPGLNPGVRVPDWIRRLGTPIYAVHPCCAPRPSRIGPNRRIRHWSTMKDSDTPEMFPTFRDRKSVV